MPVATPDSISLMLEGITKRFTRVPIFSPVSLSISSQGILAITGSNGTGKSTLLKIIAGVTMPTKGSCIWKKNEKIIENREFQQMLGFVSPYLELYNELTAIEHVQFSADLRGKKITRSEALQELTEFGLEKTIAESERTIKQYSSGMQQRVRLAMAFVNHPNVLLLDEPSSNLDEAGIRILFQRIDESIRAGGMIIIATNDERERKLASKEILLEVYKK